MGYSFVSCCQGPIDAYPTLTYDPDINRFIDDNGVILNDMHEIFDPWQILYLKKMGKTAGYCVVRSKRGGLVEVFFPSPWSDNTYWDYVKKYHDEQMASYRYAIDKDERR